MQSRKIMSLKTSEILKNFSRNYPETHPTTDEISLKMKSRKVAFTSRMLHSSKNPETKCNTNLPESKMPSLKSRNNPKIKLPEMFVYSAEGNKKWEQSSRT